MTKTGGCAGCQDAGAHSSAQLTGDGYAEFVPGAGQELYAGLGTDVTASTSIATINFAFSVTSGAYEIRELGVYKSDGTLAAGDRLRVAVESGKVVYRKNGTLIYTSKTLPAFPLVLDTTLLSLGASLSGATVSTTAAPAPVPDPTPAPTPAPTPSPTPSPTGSPTRVASGPYYAVIDRNTYTKPAVPALGPAGSTFVDPIFQSRILRVTDGATRPGAVNRSYRSPSSPHQNAWSANGTYFYVVSSDGSVIPFTFDASSGKAARVNPTATGDGGMVLRFYIEPQFSFFSDPIIYGSMAGGSGRTIDQYDFSTGVYTQVLDLDTLVSGLSGTYIGGVASSAGTTERIMAMFGGTSQDHHHLVVLFDRNNPANRLLLDTWASTLNGAPTAAVLNFSLHHVAIDRSGRYVLLYPTGADQASARKAPQSVAWDTQTGVFTMMPVATLPYGHDSFGYGVSVNQDCCVNTTYDGVQWQFRDLSNPTVTRDVLPQVLMPKEVQVEDHSTWNNARPDTLLPFISGIFRYGTQNGAWRALDDEIVAVQTNAPGQDPTIWRFAQHRTDVSYDGDATRVSFWYEPRPNVSHDGRWVLFTSNWEKTLGTDPDGDAGAMARQDAFVVELAPSTGTPTPPPPSPPPPPPPPPAVVPVAVGATALPGGTVNAAYGATLQASGGSGTFAWTLASGSLPAGLTLNGTTGIIAGTPTAAGTFPFSVKAADAADASNSATASFSIAVAAAPVTRIPVAIVPATLPIGRVSVAYSAAEQATGGSGSFTWSVVSGALPAGLTLNASTGAIAGTPTTAGTSAVTIGAADSADASNTSSAAYSIVISTGVKITSPRTLPNATYNVPYSYQVTAANIVGTPKWSLAGGSMPPGMTLNATTGVISGTCTRTGTWYFNARVTDASSSNTLTLGLSVK